MTHPRMRIPLICLHLHQTLNENANPSDTYHPTRCENPKPTDGLLIGWGISSHLAASGSPRDDVAVPPHPPRRSYRTRRGYRLIPGTKLVRYLYNSDNLGTETVISGVENRAARCGNPTSTGLPLIGCGSDKEPVLPGGDRFPSPDGKSFHTCTIRTHLGRIW